MGYFLLIAISLLVAFILQFFSSVYQMKTFNLHYKRLRQMGRVAIGKSKGLFYKGAIVMFAIDEQGMILDGSQMEGVTFLAKFHSYVYFNQKNIGELTKEDCTDIGRPLTKAVLDATSNYNTIMAGGEVKEKPSILSRMADVVYGKAKLKKTC